MFRPHVSKQRLSRRMRGKKRARQGQLTLSFSDEGCALRRFWQRRYYDFNMYSGAKVQEKLHVVRVAAKRPTCMPIR
jgi:hypothetical protein